MAELAGTGQNVDLGLEGLSVSGVEDGAVDSGHGDAAVTALPLRGAPAQSFPAGAAYFSRPGTGWAPWTMLCGRFSPSCTIVVCGIPRAS